MNYTGKSEYILPARLSHQFLSRGGADGHGYRWFRPQVAGRKLKKYLRPATWDPRPILTCPDPALQQKSGENCGLAPGASGQPGIFLNFS
jgi:hypothetical protein